MRFRCWLLQLADFMERRQRAQKPETFSFNAVAHKAAMKGAAVESTVLISHQIKKEILEHENSVLQSKLRDFTPGFENKPNI